MRVRARACARARKIYVERINKIKKEYSKRISANKGGYDRRLAKIKKDSENGLRKKLTKIITKDVETRLRIEALPRIELEIRSKIEGCIIKEYDDLMKDAKSNDIKAPALIHAREYLRNNKRFRNELMKELDQSYHDNVKTIIKMTEDSLRNTIRAELETELNMMVVA